MTAADLAYQQIRCALTAIQAGRRPSADQHTRCALAHIALIPQRVDPPSARTRGQGRSHIIPPQ